MTIELHHFFILTDLDAPGADKLIHTGLVEGPSNDHPGQGTANRRFFFADSVLELLFVRDALEARGGPARRLYFPQRAGDGRASPFGLVFSTPNDADPAPFPGWRYHAPFLPESQYFHIGENADRLTEPLCICMPSNLGAPTLPSTLTNAQLSVTDVQIDVPVSRLSETLTRVARCQQVTLNLNAPHRMVLTLNNGSEGRRDDLSPYLPLVVVR